MTQNNNNPNSLWMQGAMALVQDPTRTAMMSYRNVIINLCDPRITAREDLFKLPKRVLTLKEKNSLLDMIASPDEENLVLAQEIIHQKTELSKKKKTLFQKIKFWENFL